MIVMSEYKAGYAQGKSLYPYANYLINNGRTPTDWPMFHNSITHDGYTNSIAPNTNLTCWSVNWDHAILSSPIVYGGMVFISTQSSTYAVDEATGIIIWSVPIGTSATPAVSGVKVFIGGSDSKIYALDRLTGKIIWSVTTTDPIYSSPVVHDGKVFIGSGDGKDAYLYALDEDYGGEIWKQKLLRVIPASPAVAYGKVFVYSYEPNGGDLFALDENDGSIIWQRARIADGFNGQRLGGTPAVADGMVFIGSPDEKLAAINESTGAEIWGTNLLGPIYSSSPAVAYGKVFVGGKNGKLVAFNESNGNAIWINDIQGVTYTNASPSVADGKVFIGSDEGYIFVFNETNQTPSLPSTTNLIWSYTTGTEISSAPAIANGRVYFADMNGNLYSFGECAITDLNKTILELIGEFWSISKTGCSANLFQDVFQVGHVATYNNKLLLRFNEGSGSATLDVMNTNNGFLNGSPTWTTGKIGKGLRFNGINQSVIVNNSPSLNDFTRLTIEAWFKTSDSRNKSQYLVCKVAGTASGPTCSYGMYINPGKNAIGFSAGIYETNSTLNAFNVSDGNWHHLAVVVNFIGGINRTIYFDGERITNYSQAGTTSYTSDPLYVAAGLIAKSLVDFNGTIDEVAIYNETKTYEEIKRDYLIDGVIPSRYGFELAIKAGAGSGRDCLGNTNDWDTIITNDCEQSKYKRLLTTSKHSISALKNRGEATAATSAFGATLIRMDVWN